VGIIDDGAMAAEGTPRALKAEHGDSKLELHLAGGSGERAEQVATRFGTVLPDTDGALVVALERGAAQIAEVVRALDEAGLAVESLELKQPSLDDVFVAKTGRHLEGADKEPVPAEPE